MMLMMMTLFHSMCVNNKGLGNDLRQQTATKSIRQKKKEEE
jgi:hypothetical protein